MSGDISNPRETGEFVAKHSKDVTIVDEGVKTIAKLVFEQTKTKSYSIKTWKTHELNPKSMDKAAVEWVFLCDTLNFSFWSPDEKEKYLVRYKGKEYSGYWSLCAAINRALDEGIRITDPKTYASITRDELAHIFRSDSGHDMPLLEERLQVLHEAGNVLLQKYKGSFVNCLSECNKSARNLVKLVVENFSSYRDEGNFEGKRVAFYKRAQILVADIWGCCEGLGLGEFHDVDCITMFADYRIPQALGHFGALKYSEDLMKTLKEGTLLQSGDRREMEIRGCSIWATELVVEEVRRMLAADAECKDVHINAILVDFYLWDYRRSHAVDCDDFPMHRTRCIYY